VPAAWNQAFNVGAGQPYSLNELARAVAAAMGAEPRVTHLEARHEVAHAHASHDKVRRVFGERRLTALDEGLQTMAAWVRAHGARASTTFDAIEIRKNMPPSWTTG